MGTGLWAMIDPEAMETVCRNLLENAVLYSDGPPEISVRLGRRDRECGAVHRAGATALCGTAWSKPPRVYGLAE